MADFSVFLPNSAGEAPVLYHEAGAGMTKPDFDRLERQGVADLCVRDEDVGKCDRVLEHKLEDVVNDPSVPPIEKAGIVQRVGTFVASDLAKSAREQPDLDRTTNLVDNIVSCVLADPIVAGHVLQMSHHERTTASHMCVVSALSVALGAEIFGPDARVLRELGLAGMLHDLGKLAISPDILGKTEPLTPEEWMIIQQHPIESVRLIGENPNANMAVRQIILQHHERVDGRGYPLGLSGDDILLTTKALTIVDTFHAMIGPRSYRAALSPVEANRLLSNHAGRQLDAELIPHWEALFARWWHSQVTTEQSNGATASVSEKVNRNEHRTPPKRPPQPKARPTRFACDGKLLVKCIYAGRLHDTSPARDEFLAPVHDISRGGLCIYASHPMYRGEVINVHVQAGDRKVWASGTVVWCRSQPGNIFKVGLRFVHRLAESDARMKAVVKDMVTGEHAPTAAGRPVAAMPTRSPGTAKRSKRDKALDSLAALASMRRVGSEGQRTAIMLSMSADVEVRLKSIEVLTQVATAPAREALSSMLNDVNSNVRAEAAAAVGALRFAPAQGTLRKLLKDRNINVALRAAGALGRLDDASGLPIVLRNLKSDGSASRLAARVFGEIVGHSFGSNMEGVRSARRYADAKYANLVP